MNKILSVLIALVMTLSIAGYAANMGLGVPANTGAAVGIDASIETNCHDIGDITIISHKIVCEDEADLPNWGNGKDDAGKRVYITEATAADFLAQHEDCWAEEGWHFQWALNQNNPGDNTGESPLFNTFGPTDEDGKATLVVRSNDNSVFKMREVFDEDYLPFTGTKKDDVSAEFYCHKDVGNYDNFDYVTGPKKGGTYYCVAFNVPLPYCGDGKVNQDNEECDDGNNDDGDGCTSECVIEYCGDGIVQEMLQEECDDGNNDNGDGCNEFCMLEKEPPEVVAYKIVCEDEADLPNWGAGGSDITATTAADFLAQHEDCWAEEGWHFQWAHSNVPKPDNNEGELPPESGWTTFGPTDANGMARTFVDTDPSLVKVREVPQEGYIPFTGTVDGDVSAEIYCHKDVGKYDNHDFVHSPEEGETYYCVAFNAPIQYGCYATEVVEYIPGTQKNGNPLPANRADPTKALGEPQDDDTLNFVSLGFNLYQGDMQPNVLEQIEQPDGGVLILGFDKEIVNIDGYDIKLYETSYGSPSCSAYPEWVKVYASVDALTWNYLGEGCLDGEYELGDMEYARYLKFVDITDPAPFPASGDAFDVDGVEAYYCREPITRTHISAVKIECLYEEDLPNWGAGGPDITEATAADFLAQHPYCWLAPDWHFQYAPSGTANPGDNTGLAEAPWVTIGPTDGDGTIDVTIENFDPDRIWFREAWREGYLPFTGANTKEHESAELYCHKDVLNYDNYDYILNPQDMETYHCIAFNVPEMPPCDPQMELITNGGFEEPAVEHSAKWDIFTDAGWDVEWLTGETSYKGYPIPEAAMLELHRKVNSWMPYEGMQHAELDSDWDGPSGSLSGEPASVRIRQYIKTIPGREYALSFAFSPRPKTSVAENKLKVEYGSAYDNIERAGSPNTDWSEHTYTFVADEYETLVAFSDMGAKNSQGTFLDGVSVRCVPDPVCGNGILERGEECDDGNNENNDGCSATCEVEPITGVVVNKIMCMYEEDLPNWGAGGPDITEATAADFLAQHEDCWAEEGWHFQWALKGTANPGDNVEFGGEGWNLIGPTDEYGATGVSFHGVPSELVWMREVPQEGYMPFAGANSKHDVSAEMYCHKDVKNYDNYDYINKPKAGETYYCVAFNTPEAQDCEPSPEICDGIDNDCDGRVDEDFDLGGECYAGLGACENSGYLVCSPDGLSTMCDAEPFKPSEEVCDGIDNDCDGEVDEGGVCCVPSTEVCNGMDDDCDGIIDNVEDAGEACYAGIGACLQEGVLQCQMTPIFDLAIAMPNGVEWGLRCTATPGQPSEEVCDGIDNDCDGEIDEGVKSTFYRDMDQDGYGNIHDSIEACYAPEGYVEDNTDCDDSDFSVNPGAEELCNGIDDDCDGLVDEGVCMMWMPPEEEEEPIDTNVYIPTCRTNVELCNGIDDDCDGEVDEGFNVGEVCYDEVMGCKVGGHLKCNADGTGTVCNFQTVMPEEEICDGLDNDCDGLVDEGLECITDEGGTGMQGQFIAGFDLSRLWNLLMRIIS